MLARHDGLAAGFQAALVHLLEDRLVRRRSRTRSSRAGRHGAGPGMGDGAPMGQGGGTEARIGLVALQLGAQPFDLAFQLGNLLAQGAGAV